MLTINGKNPETITIGGNAVESIAIQGEIVWQIGADITPYFFIRNEYQGANTISITKHADSQGNYPSTGASMEYSYDKDTWNPVSFSGDVCSIPIANYHDIVYLRSSDGFSEFRYTPAWYSLDCSGEFIAGGDIKTLLDYTDSTINTIPECAFYKMFAGSNTIQSVSTLHFYGITTIEQYGLQSMFYDSSLTTSFDLPDLVTLEMSAMSSCFEDCTALNTVPNMPYLSVLGGSAMSYCFSGCIQITSAPMMQHVASLGSGSLMAAFQNCTALTTGPDFHNLTHIGQSALFGAFEGSGLAVMPDFTSVNRIDLYGMRRTFAGCHSLTTGFEMPLLDTINQSVFEECFDACDALVTPPVLEGVRVVAQDGMKYMFKGCSALQEGMQLKDITTIYSGQGVGGMNHLYDSCTSLNKAWAPTPAVWNTDAMEDWLYGVAATGVVMKDNNLTIPLNSTSGVPTGWTTQSNTYNELAYIHNRNMASNPNWDLLIDTGIYFTQNTSWRIKYQWKGYTNGNVVAGRYPNNDSQDWRYFDHQAYHTYDIMGSRLEGGSLVNGVDYDITCSNNAIYDNINQTYIRQGTAQTIGSLIQGYTVGVDATSIWLKSFEVFDDNGNTVFNGVAAEVEGVYGLWDSVSNQLVTNPSMNLTGEPLT